MIKKLLIFFSINFGALAFSSLFTPNRVNSEWYEALNKAPWEPPGVMFGVAWSTIMICLTIFMAIALKEQNKNLIKLYVLQLALNVTWTPIFFFYKLPVLGLIIISALTFTIGYMMVTLFFKYGIKILLLSPYIFWLIIATSLNLYIVLNN